MSKRNPDGSFRNNNVPARLSGRFLIARWVKAEVFALKRLGLSCSKIADSIGRAGRKEIKPANPLPDVEFPDGYSIDPRSVRRIFDKAIKATPAVSLEAYRKLDNERAEDLYLATQPGVAARDPEAIRAALRVLDHIAMVNGYGVAAEADMKAKKARARAEAPPEDTDKDTSFQIAVMQALTDEERRTVIEILDRARGRVSEAEAGQTRGAVPAAPTASDRTKKAS